MTVLFDDVDVLGPAARTLACDTIAARRAVDDTGRSGVRFSAELLEGPTPPACSIGTPDGTLCLVVKVADEPATAPVGSATVAEPLLGSSPPRADHDGTVVADLPVHGAGLDRLRDHLEEQP